MNGWENTQNAMNDEDHTVEYNYSLPLQEVELIRAMPELDNGPVVFSKGVLFPTVETMTVLFDRIQELFDQLEPKQPRCIVFDLRGLNRPSADTRTYIKKRLDNLTPRATNIALVTDWNRILFNTTVRFIMTGLLSGVSFHNDLQESMNHTHKLLQKINTHPH